jgi:predicted metal-dependent hydrolase
MQKTITYPRIGEITLSRTRRSTRITLSVRPNGAVRLSFPLWVTQRRALSFLDEKVEWIVTARQKMAEKYAPPGSPVGSDGLGGFGGSNPGAPHTPGTPGPTNPLSQADKLAQRQAQKRAQEALRAIAREKLPLMVARLAAEHGFHHGAVRIKATRSRWGSCTVRNDINLSLSLAALPDHLAEYIVLHELCHTVHKNHSWRFHALLDGVTGGRSKALNRELRQFRPDAIPPAPPVI